jgi:hypothetical protein
VPLAGLEPATCCLGDVLAQTLCSIANLLVGTNREAKVILWLLAGLLDELPRATRTRAAPISWVTVMAARQRRGRPPLPPPPQTTANDDTIGGVAPGGSQRGLCPPSWCYMTWKVMPRRWRVQSRKGPRSPTLVAVTWTLPTRPRVSTSRWRLRR